MDYWDADFCQRLADLGRYVTRSTWDLVVPAIANLSAE